LVGIDARSLAVVLSVGDKPVRLGLYSCSFEIPSSFASWDLMRRNAGEMVRSELFMDCPSVEPTT
jgi:hypothetical protein